MLAKMSEQSVKYVRSVEIEYVIGKQKCRYKKKSEKFFRLHNSHIFPAKLYEHSHYFFIIQSNYL